MDIIVNVEKKSISSQVVISLSFCDTNETMLFYIAHALETLPSYMEWDIVPSWSVLYNTTEFTCKDNLSFLLNSSETTYPAHLPKTEKFQKTFISTHQRRQDPRFLEYFNQQDFILPLRDLNDPAIFKEEQSTLANVLQQRDKNLTFCACSKSYCIEDVNIKYKRFVVKLPNNLELSSIFDRFTLSDQLPFVIFQGIVKSYQYFKAPVKWLDINSPGIVFKIRHDFTTEKFSTGIIVQDDLDYFCILDTSEFYKTVDDKILLKVLKQALDMQMLELLEQSTVLTYNILYEEFHDCYMADLIMHQLSNIFYIDEYIRPSKSSNRLYIHLADETGAMSIFQKYTQKPLQFPDTCVSTPFITVRIRSENSLLANRIRYLLNCLLNFYSNQVNSIRKFYGKYTRLRQPHRQGPTVVLEKIPLKLIAPDIFLPMYSRRCLNMPSIVLEKDVGNRPSMKFPVFGESQQRIYVCNHKKYKFPGLRVNELENRDKFPYVPCCYSKDQKLNPNSKLNNYLKRKPIKPKIKQSIGAILNLPIQLKKYFTLVDTLHDYILLSNPVGSFSFLTAVWYALYKTKLPDHIKDNLIKTFKSELCAQEAFPTSFNETINPLLHIRLLEVGLGVSIFLFSKSGPLLPNFKRIYLKPFPAKKVVFIYVKSTDHCLPITRTGASEIYFLHKTSIVKTVFSHIERLSPHSFTNQSVFEYFSKFTIKGQILNADNHCVFFICSMNDTDIPIATDPQVPFSAPIIDKIFRLSNPRPIEKFFKNMRYIISHNFIREAIIPFSAQARILTHFPSSVIAEKSILKSKSEKFKYMDIGDITFLYNFVFDRKNAKKLLRTLNTLIKSHPIQMNDDVIVQWLKSNPNFLPPVAQSDRELLIRKLAFLIRLRHVNHVKNQHIDLHLLNYHPKVVLTQIRDILKTPLIHHHKPEIKYLEINDTIRLNGKIFSRVQESPAKIDKLPELIYFPETDKFYSTTDFEEAVYNKFKLITRGNVIVLECVKNPSQ